MISQDRVAAARISFNATINAKYKEDFFADLGADMSNPAIASAMEFAYITHVAALRTTYMSAAITVPAPHRKNGDVPSSAAKIGLVYVLVFVSTCGHTNV